MSSLDRGKSKCRSLEEGGAFNNREKFAWRAVDVDLEHLLFDFLQGIFMEQLLGAKFITGAGAIRA